MSGKVLGIYIAEKEGEPMQEVPKIGAIKQLGLEGDRYTGERGISSVLKYGGINHLSLIEQEAIDKVKWEHGIEFPAKLTRRNIITTGIALNNLIGKEFWIWGVKMRGASLCHPCNLPSKLWEKQDLEEKPSFKKLFAGFGGLRAEILTSGVIYCGANISIETYSCLICGTTTSFPHVCPEFYPELR